MGTSWQSRIAFLLFAAALGLACGDDTRPPKPRNPEPAPARAEAPLASERGAALPEAEPGELLLKAHHLITIAGDFPAARAVLEKVANRTAAPRLLRAKAELRLAEIAEVVDDRRGALLHLEAAKLLAGTGHVLAFEADDRRARILTVTPLADVRGPVPGSVVLKHQAAPTVTRFRRADALLAALHRVVVAPRLENMNEVLRSKREALAAAAAAYQRVASAGGRAARAAAFFRIGSMHQHLAEALVFELPPELLPEEARRLRRELQAESASHLRKALAAYRTALREPAGPETAPWRQLAEQEEKTLTLVLEPSSRRRAK